MRVSTKISTTEIIKSACSTYYDNYRFKEIFEANQYNFDNSALTDIEEKESAEVTGLVTGSQTRMLNSEIWLKAVNYYDDRCRLIQTISDNHLNGKDTTSYRYDFSGKVLAKSTVHQAENSGHTVAEQFTYDPVMQRHCKIKLIVLSLNLPATAVTQKLDSVNQLRKNSLASFEKDMQSLKSRATEKLKKLDLPPEMSEKAALVTKNIDGIKIPTSDNMQYHKSPELF